MPPEDTATEEKPCKATARFVIDYRLGVVVKCSLNKTNHRMSHQVYGKSTSPKMHREPGYYDTVNILYYWDGEYVE
jgi:hypothetical protein